MPDMSALDDILVEIAQTALPSTRRHYSLDRLRKTSSNSESPANRTRPSLPNLTHWQQRDLIHQQSQPTNSSPSLNPRHDLDDKTDREQEQPPIESPTSSLPPVAECNDSSLLRQPVVESDRLAGSDIESNGDRNGPFTNGSCTFPRRSARFSDLRLGPLDHLDFHTSSQVRIRNQDEDSGSSESSDRKSAEHQHLPCPFDTFLNLEFVEFCSNLASIKLPESVRQSFRKAATLRKKKWRKSMDQMLYSEEVLSSIQPSLPPNQQAQAKSLRGGNAGSEGLTGGQVVEDSHELNEAVRNFEQTLQRHLSNTYKDSVSALRIVEEDEEELSFSYAAAASEDIQHGPALIQTCDSTVQLFTIPEQNDTESRESLFTVPKSRAPKPASSFTSSPPTRYEDKELSAVNSPANSLQAVKSVSCNSINSTVTISAYLLESIREKLATSLEQMQYLQTRAELIPQLEAQIITLQKELSLARKVESAVSMSDAGIMTSLEAPTVRTVAVSSSATNTPVRETRESGTCQTPPPHVEGLPDEKNKNSERKRRKVRSIKSAALATVRASPARVKRKIKRNALKTDNSLPNPANTVVIQIPAEIAELAASRMLNLDDEQIVDDSIGGKNEANVVKEKVAVSLDDATEAPPTDYDDLSDLRQLRNEISTDEGFQSRKESSDGGSISAYLPPIKEESQEGSEHNQESATATPGLLTNTVSTSGVSDGSNASMSSSNSDELDLMASFATSESSDHEDEGSYDLLHGQLSNKCFEEIPESDPIAASNSDEGPLPRTVSKELLAACKVLKDSLHRGRESRGSARIESSLRVIQQEWFAVAGRKTALADVVNTYLDTFESLSKKLLNAVVNLLDNNGNTVLHYALSHNNFAVVSVILDSKVCNVDMVNQAGYTPVMLASLAPLSCETDRAIAIRLFGMGDINRRAQQHGQTALMLAVSHGRVDTVQMLLQVGADVNIQDNDGSTALMCASEHGHTEIVRLLLAHSDIDVQLTDQDGMCALYVAMEAGHKEIAALIYAKTTSSSSSSERNGQTASEFTPFNSSKRKPRMSANNGNQTATL